MTEEESDVEGEETGPPDQFVGKDILESYIYYLNAVPSNPLERYHFLIKTVSFGKELLPFYDDPSETDKDKIQANKTRQEEIDVLYNNAVALLKSEIPAKRTIRYSYVDDGNELHPVYKISAYEDQDAKPCEAQVGELTTILNNFVTMQHEHCTPKLQEVSEKIFHELSQVGIVPSINPMLDQMVAAEAKSLFREINQPEEEDKDGGKERKI
jgi:hypothetical protein